MRVHSNPLPTLLLVLLALGCGPSLGAARSAAPTQDPPLERPPIRFGDPPGAYAEPFFPGADHDPRLPTPTELLGQEHGSRLAHHAEILAAFRLWSEASERMRLFPMGKTHEGRELVYAVVTSPENHARLEQIRTDLARLFDPRGLPAVEAERILAGTPPVAWMAYSIHGDELSGSDASLAVAHHLIADRTRETAELLERIVVVIDPCMNPDGRQRILGMVEQSAGYMQSLDHASMHRGRWPYGRGNHYLFDMNRDWIAGTQPETRARWRAVLAFHPQLFVDAHEMGSLDTYLFYPQARPILGDLRADHVRWQSVFAADIARAFDRHGWGYYTREWADGWAPFYSDAWGSLIGAVGMLYEQARTAGFPLQRASGEVLAYREAVHHQAEASLACLRTLAERRAEILGAYLEWKRTHVDPDLTPPARVLALRPQGNVDRSDALLAALLAQGVEVRRTTANLEARGARGTRGEELESLELPAGSLFVPLLQPQAPLVNAFLGFDPRLPLEDLVRERESLERKGESRIYDITSWSLPLAFDLDAWWCELAPGTDSERVDAVPARVGSVAAPADPTRPVYAWIVDGARDASVSFAARALELGLAVHFADEPFTAAGRAFSRGSLLIRRHENDQRHPDLAARIERAAREARVEVVPTDTGRSADDGPDLGGGHFHLLARPRIAVLANAPVASDRYGHLWHHLDVELGVPFTLLDAQELGWADLRRYNVLILPPAGGGLRPILRGVADELAAWIESGGTLIACEESAALITRGNLELSQVVLRHDALDELERYRAPALRARAAREIVIDEGLLWDGAPRDPPAAAEDGPETMEESKDEPEPPFSVPGETDEERERWLARFAPRGAMLLGECRAESWLTAGSGDTLPVLVDGADVYLAPPSVETAVRLASAERLRLSGLLWPEARHRLADSAWLTRESRGSGQIILFASTPAFRGIQRGSARLFSNAVIYGPGLGADQPIGR